MTDDDLVTLHDAHHERLHDHVFALLDRLVDVDIAAAHRIFTMLRAELDAGLALEDDLILPRYATLPLPSPAGRVDHVQGDHVILIRTLDAIAAWLATLSSSSPSRRGVLAGLPVVYRLLGTLEHHQERERQHVYPTVARALTSTEHAFAVSTLRRLVAGDTQP